MMRKRTARYMIPLLSGLLLAPGLLAQTGDDATGDDAYQQEPDGMAEQQDFDQQTLEQFADAYVAVGEIHDRYSEELQAAESTDDAQQLQQQANDEMVDAIQEQGLEVQEYSAIAAALERDPDMREEVVGMIEARK